MECRNVRELADSFLSEQLLVETTHEILQHLAQCPSCRAEVDARRRLRTGLRTAFERAPELRARPGFLTSISARIRDNAYSRRPLRNWRAAVAIAAGLLLASSAALGGREWLGVWRFAALAHAAAGDHQNCALQFKLAEQPISLEEAAERFDPAYRSLAAIAPSPAILDHSVINVLERHVCLFDGHRFAHIVLNYRGHVISVLVTSDRLARIPPELDRVDALRVASFRVARFAVFVVSPSSEQETRDVAAAMAGPLRRALTGV